MSVEFSQKPSSRSRRSSANKSYLLAMAIASTSLFSALTLTSMTTQAASLGDLFSSNKSAGQSKFLPVDQAFQVVSSAKTTATGTRLAINFDITPEHYVYRDQIKLTLPAGVTAAPFSFSQSPQSIDDPTFGRVAVFDQRNVVATTILTSSNGKSIDNAAVTIGWQGCAKAGLCYPPEKVKTTVNIVATVNQALTKTAATSVTANVNKKRADQPATTESQSTPSISTKNASDSMTGADKANGIVNGPSTTANQINSSTITTGSVGGSEDDANNGNARNPQSIATDNVGQSTNAIATDSILDNSRSSIDGASMTANNDAAIIKGLDNTDPFGLASHPWLAFGLLFLAGLLLALTPCVLPMLPIVTNIVARQTHPTVKKSVILTTSYAIGVSTAYGLLGALIAVFGEALGIIGWLQNPIILISFAIVFAVLAFYMLGVFTIRLPHSLRHKLQGLSQAADSKLGSVGGSLVAGFLSALVVSPCVTGPLSGALLGVSTIGSPLLGFAALFTLGFGLSLPLILIGASQGSIMPKAGAWMDWIKQGFALLLFAVSLLLIERVFISSIMLLVWALWFMVVATWAWSWLGRGRLLSQAIALIVGIWALCLVVGAALGNDDSLHPLASLNSLAAAPVMATNTQASNDNVRANGTPDIRITTLTELDRITAATPKVLIDVTADWCVECRIMDKNLFASRPVQMQDWQLVRLDITETTADSKAILARYQLFGPPALLYYKDGQPVKKQVGEIGRVEFEKTLATLNQ